jgi:hypothetical protein
MSVDPHRFQFENFLFSFKESSLISPPLVLGDEGEGETVFIHPHLSAPPSETAS